MKRGLTMVTVAGLIFIGTQALALDAPSRSAINRRQLKDCMMERMTANKTMSYIEATKVCNDQIKAQSVHAASNVPLASNAARLTSTASLTSNTSMKSASTR
jgi:hypothetical protein